MGEAILAPSSSVGVKTGSIFVSSGLLVSDDGVRMAGLGRVGSSPEGYDRGSGLRENLEREELVDAMDGANSLFPVEVEKVDDAIDNRERNDEVDEVVYDDATELRPEQLGQPWDNVSMQASIRESMTC